MKKNSAQTLVLVLVVVVIFTAIIIIIAAITTRGLEMRELEEVSLKASYASDTGWERGMYYLKKNKTPDQVITINQTNCPDSTNSTNCNNDLNPMGNKYSYSVIITPPNTERPNGELCISAYCLDTTGFGPE